MTEADIIRHINSGDIFGALEVDLQVPQQLKDHFQEMTPIFKNTIIRKEDIGEHMQEFLTETGKTFKDTKYLIGSMFGQKILLITPLLKWYIEHGVEVSKIYQVIEFSPARAFQSFEQSVTNDRRAGDRDPAYAAIADTSKLIGSDHN